MNDTYRALVTIMRISLGAEIPAHCAAAANVFLLTSLLETRRGSSIMKLARGFGMGVSLSQEPKESSKDSR